MSKDDSFSDIIVSFAIMLTGAAEAAHLSGVVFHRPFAECTILFGALALAALAVVLAFILWRRNKTGAGFGIKGCRTGREKLLFTVFACLVLVQIVYVAMGKNIYRQGDMTVETVGSFLQNNGIYLVNPLTGGSYEGGIPSRLKILCLPTMYASLSSIFHISPELLVWRVVPVAVLFCCYGAYSSLGRSLFPGERSKQLVFLIAVSLLIWAGSYAYGVDGFNVLFSGWRGVTFRNAVLIPYALSLCLRKKYFHALLCVLAEVCIVWTLYGLGACVIVISGVALVEFLRGRRTKRGEAVK